MFASHNLFFDTIFLLKPFLSPRFLNCLSSLSQLFSAGVLLIQFGIKTPTFKSVSELGGLSFHGDQGSSGIKLDKI